MLLPDNIHPEQCIYYNAAFVIEELRPNENYNFLELYQSVKVKQSMSIFVFTLCLDWLYLLNVVTINDYGEIELCS